MSQSYMPKSKSDTHITPQRVYDLINEWWGYNKENMFDPCPVNADFDGLSVEWKSLNYINPPYKLLDKFVFKAMSEFIKHRKTSILLLPSKTDQLWFHNLCDFRYATILWILGRLRFENNKNNSPQPHFLAKIG